MRSLIAIALIATPAVAQTDTNCFNMGGTLHCQTTPSPGAAAVPNVGQQMLDSMAADTRQQNAISANRQLQQQQLGAQAAQGSADRRAAAYNQVGALIAQGKCAEAKKLARFYNHPDIIADTDKACS